MMERVREIAARLGLDCVGVTSAALYNRAMGTRYATAIVVLLPYYAGHRAGANVSCYTYGRDYHLVAREKLAALAQQLGLDDYRIHADIGPAIDRALAVQAGLGFLGRNGLCIHDRYGSYCFIAYLVCHLSLPLSKPDTRQCMGCNACVSACPGGALTKGFQAEKCLSHITQKKGELSPEEGQLIAQNGLVFGCDVCQQVCPHNRETALSPLPEFRENLCTRITAGNLAGLSSRQFQKEYSSYAFAWRGKGVLERNLGYIAGKNVKKYPLTDEKNRSILPVEGDDTMSRFYVCKHCGNLIGMIYNAGVPMKCCGENMTELVANTTDAAQEKHLPVVTVADGTVSVNVGSVAHPMSQEHSILWVYLETDKGGQRKALAPDAAPEVTFALGNDKPVAVYAYCNLHGLWKTDI